MVWVAGYRIGYSISKICRLYAIVGDDIIIFNQRLADSYRSLSKEANVIISEYKSLVPYTSESGNVSSSLEFLSRQYLDNLEVSRLPSALIQRGSSELFCAELLVRDFFNNYLKGSRPYTDTVCLPVVNFTRSLSGASLNDTISCALTIMGIGINFTTGT